jgi:signal transduction histidine kinase
MNHMQAGDTIHDGISIQVATLGKRHVARESRERSLLLAESAESLLHRVQRHSTLRATSTLAAELDSSAMCQWMVDLTYFVVKSAFVGIAQVNKKTWMLEPLAEAGQPQDDRHQWWMHLQRALFGERAVQRCEERLTEGPIVLQLPPQLPTARTQAQQARTICTVPINVDGGLSAILAVELPGSSRDVPAAVMTLVRAMASAAMPALEALDHGRAQLVQQMKALRETLSEMDGAVSLATHELRSPLTTIIGCLQLIMPKIERLTELASDFPGVEKTIATIQDLLAMASRSAQIEERIATDLVEASRIRNGKITLLPSRCDLGQIVQESVGAQCVTEPRRIIHLEVPDRDIPVSADPDRIVQVLTNFLGNALKYSAKEAPVEVSVKVLKRSARVSVRDYGPGLEQSEIKRVWQRFYQVSGVPTNSAAGSGLGLGLYIGREIVREHGGKVGVTSVLGRGATFWFTLPLATTT